MVEDLVPLLAVAGAAWMVPVLVAVLVAPECQEVEAGDAGTWASVQVCLGFPMAADGIPAGSTVGIRARDGKKSPGHKWVGIETVILNRVGTGPVIWMDAVSSKSVIDGASHRHDFDRR